MKFASFQRRVGMVLARREFYFIALAFGLLLDIELTYYGIEVLGLSEGNSISKMILDNSGWYGVALTYLGMMFLFGICLKLVDVKKYVWARYVLSSLCVYHLVIPVMNIATISEVL